MAKAHRGKKLSEETKRKISESLKNKKKTILVGIIAETKKLSIEDFISDDPSAIDEFIKRKFAESEKDRIFLIPIVCSSQYQ